MTVFDYGSLGTDGAFLVMELVNGQTLRHELRRDVRLAPERIAYIMEGVCDAVAEAHKAGVIHRDLKPENILLTEADDPSKQIVKVLDFGIAKILSGGDDMSPSITVPGSVMGTLGYMSPEQIEGRPVDVRTDIFALGVIAIEALTGSRPFSGSTIAALAASMTSERVEIDIDEPGESGLVEILTRAVARDPDQRYGDVTEFREALVTALRLSEAGPQVQAGSNGESEAPTVFAPSIPEEVTEARGSFPAFDAAAPVESPVTAAIASESARELNEELPESRSTGEAKEPEAQ